MKSFFLSCIALVLWMVPVVSHAVFYPLSATKTTSGITVTMTGVPNDQSHYELHDGETIFPPTPVAAQVYATAQGDKVVWNLSAPEKTYYFYVIKKASSVGLGQVDTQVTDVVPFSVGTNTTSPTLLSTFTISPSGDRKVTISGKINRESYSDMRRLKIVFEYSQTGTSSDGPTNGHALVSGQSGQSQIAEDGTYSLVVSDLTPSTKYYFKQSIFIEGSTTPIETKTDTFTAEKGYIAPGTVGEQLDFNSRSYHLLAPLPGLSVLMDPDLCAEKKTKGELPPNAICDVNGFLNFAFKFMIGLTAVVLVLRLMYEGYQYIVTDVPFIKANAKSGFFNSLLGLLLALSAYLILNTINPKLVDNRINIDNVSVGIDDVYDRADDPNFIARLDSVSIDGVTANINDETVLVYLAHQQGIGGLNAILAAAKNNTPVPSKINNNMSKNFNTKDALRTIKTSTLTPTNFLNYWAIKVGAFKKNPSANIPDSINTQLGKVSQETGISLITLQVTCRIESSCNGQKAIENVNPYGYAGLFQLSNSIYMKYKKPGVWEQFKKADGQILNAYHNAYAAAGYMKSNLSLLKR